MPHNPFSVTFIFLESAPLSCQSALFKLSQTSRSWSTTLHYDTTVYLIYSMCTSHKKNKRLPSPSKQSDDQKKHGAQGELIRWTNTFLLDIFVGFIILHQVTAEEKKNKALFSSLWHQCSQSGRTGGGEIKAQEIIYLQLNTNNVNLNFSSALHPASNCFLKSRTKIS